MYPQKPSSHKPIIIEDPWTDLRQVTAARIALGRAGSSLPLREILTFKLDHARARDAVHAPFAQAELSNKLAQAGFSCLELESAVADRSEYLTRPDKGRRLSDRSKELLASRHIKANVCLVIGDGLSAQAVQERSLDLICYANALFERAGLTVGPVSIVRNARVAVGDEIAQFLLARLVIIMIGERPGLSSPNSMGVYLTMNPIPGTTDEKRNCISNIRAGGLPVIEAMRKLGYLIEEALRLGTSGVELKDRMLPNHLPFGLPLIKG